MAINDFGSRDISTSWFGESAADRSNREYKEPKSSFGRFQGTDTKTFNEHFEELYKKYKDAGIDIKRDIKQMLSDPVFMEQYKTELMAPTIQGFQEASENDPHIYATIDNVNRYWDTKVNIYNESASMAAYLPISTL